MTCSAEARRHSRLLWPPLVGSVPFFASCVFFVDAARELETATYPLSGAIAMVAIGLMILGLVVIACNVLAAARQPSFSFLGGLGSIGASLLFLYAAQQTDVGWAIAASWIWAVANAAAVLYALGGGPIHPRD